MSWDRVAGGGSFGEEFNAVAGDATAPGCCLGWTVLFRELSAEGEVAEVLKKPSLDELPSRAILMFSSVRKPFGLAGDWLRAVSVRFFVWMCVGPSEGLGLVLGTDAVAAPNVAAAAILGVSFTIGEY